MKFVTRVETEVYKRQVLVYAIHAGYNFGLDISALGTALPKHATTVCPRKKWNQGFG